jgi:hypothetical protein
VCILFAYSIKKLAKGKSCTNLLYDQPNITGVIKSMMKWVGHVTLMGETRNAYQILVGKPTGKRPLGRRKRRWEDNIRMHVREIWLEGVDWIHLA